MLYGVENLLESPQLQKSTKPPLKVPGCIPILLFVGLWRAGNVDDLVDDFGCRWSPFSNLESVQRFDLENSL